MNDDRALRRLVARETVAREALHSLRECDREIERITGRVPAIVDREAADPLVEHLLALRALAKQIRESISEWDSVGGTAWRERVPAQLELLAAGVAQAIEATSPLPHPAADNMRAASTPGAAERSSETGRWPAPRRRTRALGTWGAAASSSGDPGH